ncbi:hypothetical protein FXB41_30500 [Bradyrhizobium canariense]|nr:hypothetical protein [Bradyrhizobium canariense]
MDSPGGSVFRNLRHNSGRFYLRFWKISPAPCARYLSTGERESQVAVHAKVRAEAPSPLSPQRDNDLHSGETTTSFGNFRLDRARRLLTKDGKPVRIGSRALDLLIVLIDRAGEVVSRRELVDLAWRGVAVDDAGVRVHIASLRRVLGDGRDGARYIVNVSGVGYSFVASVTREATEAPSLPTASPAPRLTGRVPPPPRLLVGRDDVVNSLVELLLERRFVSIVGSGGIGKTTTATAVADRLRAEFGDDNIAFVDLGAVSDPERIPEAIISAIGCRIGGADPVEEILNFLTGRRVLIIFDSCEHLLDSTSGLAARLFQQAPAVHLLTTSREALRVDGETIHLLSPLACPMEECPTAAQALATPAVQLFLDRAKFSGFNGELSDIEAPIVSGICRRTDGIALAIEMAASRVGTYGISGVANLIVGNVDLGLVGRRDAAPRHRTLESMLDWSFRLLNREEQRVLSALSMLVGLFTMDAACSITNNGDHDSANVSRTIMSLIDRSLVWVHREGDTVFYRLPDTTRAYAAAKLAETEQTESIAARHALYFSKLFKATALEHGTYADIGRHAPHVGNLRKALEWTFSNEKSRPLGVQLAADTAPLFLGLWLLNECRHWSQLALSFKDDLGEIPESEARLQEALAVSTMYTLGNTPEVRNALERGLVLSEALGQAPQQLRLLGDLALFFNRTGDFGAALAAVKRSGAIAERSDSPEDRINAEWLMAASSHMAGDQLATIAHYERGSRLEATTGRAKINLFGYDDRLRAQISLARCVWLRGSPDSACKLAIKAMDDAAEISLPSNYTMAITHSVPVLLWSGNTVESALYIERLLVHAERLSIKTHTSAALALRGEWLLMTGDFSTGVETLRQALERLSRERLHMLTPTASIALADGLSQCGNHDEARATIDGALSSAREMNQQFYLPSLLRTQGQIILRSPQPDFESAESSLRKSIEIAGMQASPGWELKAAVPLARLLIQTRRIHEALALIGPIYRAHSEKTGSTDLVAAASILEAPCDFHV